jgi:hypothetical protein
VTAPADKKQMAKGDQPGRRGKGKKRDTSKKRSTRATPEAARPVPDVELVALPAEDVVVDACAFCGQDLPLPWVVALRAHEGDLSDDLIGAFAVCEAHAQGTVRLLARALGFMASTVTERADPSGVSDAPQTTVP